MQRVTRCLPVLIGLLAAAAWGQQGPPRLAVPNEAKLKETGELVQEIFRADFAGAKTAEQKVELAKMLAKQAAESKDEPAGRYVLLTEARKLAAVAGDVELALEMVERQAAVFEIARPLQFKLEVLSRVSPGSPAEHKQLAVQAAAVVEQAVAGDDFETAAELAKIASASARKGRDLPLASQILKRSKQVDELAQAYAEVAAARQKLAAAPTDAGANLTVGRYLCFKKGNFQQGLSMLALGSDSQLKSLAAADLAAPAVDAERVKLGDRWWELAEATEEPTQQQWMQVRASHWYRQALPKLTGLTKLKVEKRLAAVKDVEPAGSPGAAIRSSTVDLIALLDPEQDFRPKDKWELQDGQLHCTKQHFVPKVIFPYQPPEEYDVRFVFSQPKLRNGVGLIMPHPAGGTSFSFTVAGAGGSDLFWFDGDNKYRQRIVNAYQPNAKYTVELKVRKEGLECTVNGKKIFQFQPDYNLTKVNSWRTIKDEWRNIALAADDPAVFYEIKLTEVTGEGKRTREETP